MSLATATIREARMQDSPAPPAARLAAASKLSLAAVLALTMLMMLPTVASASHNPDFYAAQQINGPNTPMPSFFEASPYVVTHDNLGTDITNIGEPITCTFGADVTHYGRTVYYEFHPDRNGRVRIVASSLTSGFRPLVSLIPFELSSGAFGVWVCNGSQPPINRATLPAEGYINVAAGGHYKIQVAGENNPNLAETSGVPTSGNFQFIFVYDPNSDGDPLFDSQDQCANTDGGPNSIAGCPDGDNDDVRDLDDQCDTQHNGPRGIRGCPDTDGDGKADQPDAGSDLPADACDREDARTGRDRNDNGCPDREQLRPDVVLDPGSFCRGSVCFGITVEELVVSGVPRGTRVDVSCTRRACGRITQLKKRKKPIRVLRGRRLRAGVKVTIRVTKKGSKPGYLGRYFSYRIKINNLEKTGVKPALCLKKRTARPRRCTQEQLIR